eukprot:CAMPEP_0194687346 /NCGR_PEP_ID=MMETSP0295-20121207/16178_1 /TAXON_ID=39354 /ORGANISM="Heterosigma akashiwo, Strain CCMP2393" /LENGTH=159 /DNA_ID=CAMNT_0039575613 /DNA_START=1002 /DNA_END=1481 /DNA_ORIENTATION=+
MADELGGPPEEGQAVVVVQAPDAVAARGLHHVGGLQPVAQAQVPREHPQHGRREVRPREHLQLEQAAEEDHEVGLVAGAVVDARLVAEGGAQVGRELQAGPRRLRRQQRAHQRRRLLDELGVPGAEGLVPEAHGLLQRRVLPHPALQRVQQPQQAPDYL